jgi:hypothetical protein
MIKYMFQQQEHNIYSFIYLLVIHTKDTISVEQDLIDTIYDPLGFHVFFFSVVTFVFARVFNFSIFQFFKPSVPYPTCGQTGGYHLSAAVKIFKKYLEKIKGWSILC